MDKGPLSPDGKYWWDGQKWNPVEKRAGPQPQPPHRAAGERSKWLSVPAVIAGLIVCFPIGLVLTWLTPWSRRTKLIITGITSALVVICARRSVGFAATEHDDTERRSLADAGGDRQPNCDAYAFTYTYTHTDADCGHNSAGATADQPCRLPG